MKVSPRFAVAVAAEKASSGLVLTGIEASASFIVAFFILHCPLPEPSKSTDDAFPVQVLVLVSYVPGVAPIVAVHVPSAVNTISVMLYPAGASKVNLLPE